MSDWLTPDALEQAREILQAGPICDECLGRGFAKLGRGLSNATRGEMLRDAVSIAAATKRCWVCNGLFEGTDAWAVQGAELAAGIEFSTYLFGVKLTPRLKEIEAYRNERFPTEHGGLLKHAFNRLVGLAFEQRVGVGTVDFNDPHISFLVDLAGDDLSMRIASLYVYGRYRKLVRGIPQTRWPCRRCKGRGCDTCDMTGKQYPESVEEWIGGALVEAAAGAGHKLHGAGREDIDARMLGSGRPFILEIVSPRCRSLDLEALRDRVNDRAAGRVEVSPLSFVSGSAVGRIKELDATKRYFANIEFEADLTSDQFEGALRSLVGRIDQRTPRRVAHRRADKVRERHVLAISGELTDPRHAGVEIEGEGGLYIKELISGDDGRTVPSLAERLDVAARVTELDVLDVCSDAFEAFE
ncbi:tRNA pseudouridine(54/55) synthase Pus10 [Candidatus Bipolaricaulota bacterium]